MNNYLTRIRVKIVFIQCLNKLIMTYKYKNNITKLSSYKYKKNYTIICI